MQINSDDSTKIAIWVGGKHSNARSKPTFHKLAVAGLPNNAPRWPEVAEVVKTILHAYKEGAKDWERVGEWIDRIGWPKFFVVNGLAFSKQRSDEWQGARKDLNAFTDLHF